MNAEDDLVIQQEELYALEAIYGDDCRVDHEQRMCQVYLPNAEACPQVVVRVHLPDGYPSSIPPVAEIEAPHLSDDIMGIALQQLEDLFVPGEVVVFTWINALKEQEELWLLHAVDSDAASSAGDSVEDGLEDVPEEAAAFESRERAVVSEDEELANKMAPLIVSGEPFLEKKSTFQAHVCEVHSYKEVQAVVAVLLRNNKIRNATHNIMAYRIVSEGTGAVHQDYDDDGEQAAGGRLLHLLQVADAKNVVVVVSRWFGGVLLGPARFTHINNAGRMLLEQEGFIQAAHSKGPSAGKKRKKK